MDLDGAMDEALRVGPEALAIACADVHAGFVIGASARGDAEREAATNAAACAAQLCAMPRLADGRDEDDEAQFTSDEKDASGALVVSSRWIHAYARVANRPDLVVVGVARGDANVALVLDWVKRVAGGLGAEVGAAF
jgi:CelD/BcsL family acetyltransferase involved in cellulose biosynthesis